MARQRLRTKVLADLYNTITEATEQMPAKDQVGYIRTVGDIAERMEIEDIESMTCVLKALLPTPPKFEVKRKRATKPPA